MALHHRERTESLLSISDAQHGLLTTSQARYLLGSASAALSLAESGEWERLSRSLYRRTGSVETFPQRCLAAVLDLGGDTVASHHSALALYATSLGESAAPAVLDLIDTAVADDAAIHVSSTSSRRRRDALAVVHRVATLPDRWRTIQRGIPVAAPSLIALQVFGFEAVDVATAVVDTLVAAELVTVGDMALVVDQLGERGRSGTGAMRAYLANHRTGV